MQTRESHSPQPPAPPCDVCRLCGWSACIYCGALLMPCVPPCHQHVQFIVASAAERGSRGALRRDHAGRVPARHHLQTHLARHSAAPRLEPVGGGEGALRGSGDCGQGCLGSPIDRLDGTMCAQKEGRGLEHHSAAERKRRATKGHLCRRLAPTRGGRPWLPCSRQLSQGEWWGVGQTSESGVRVC